MVRIIPNRLKSYTGGNGTNSPSLKGSRSSSPNPAANMSTGSGNGSAAAAKVNGLMLRVVVLRVSLPVEETSGGRWDQLERWR